MSTVACKQVEDQLLDYIYEELGEAEAADVRRHIESCPSCRSELDGFGRVRTAAKLELPFEEPSAAVSAKLLYQAQQLAPKPRGKVLQLFRRALSHPAYAMAASFVLVGGIAGWQLFTHTMHAATAPAPMVVSDGTPDPTTPTAQAPTPTAAAAAPAGEPALAKEENEKNAQAPENGYAVKSEAAPRTATAAEPKPSPAAHAAMAKKKGASVAGSLDDALGSVAENAPASDGKTRGEATGGGSRQLPLSKDENPVLARSTMPKAPDLEKAPAKIAVAKPAPSPPPPAAAPTEMQAPSQNDNSYDRRDNGSMASYLPSTSRGQFAPSKPKAIAQAPQAPAPKQMAREQQAPQQQYRATSTPASPHAELARALDSNGSCAYVPVLARIRAADPKFAMTPGEQAKALNCDERNGLSTAETVRQKQERLQSENPSDMEVRSAIHDRTVHQSTVEARVPDGDNPADVGQRRSKKAAPAPAAVDSKSAY